MAADPPNANDAQELDTNVPEALQTLPPAAVGPPMKMSIRQWIREYFLGEDPTFGVALVPFCFVSMVLFTRHPRTNFIFDEQEALLANPYVRSVADAHPKFGWIDAFRRDFWGLGPERSIGSYRPIPNLVWRSLWALGARDQTPFLHHWINVLLHGLNGALVCLVAFHFTRRRGAAWLAGLAFTTSAVLTEAVSGVVGIADVLGGTGALLALLALTRSMPLMGVGVFFATLFGLYSKETALACVPLVPVAALFLAQITHPHKPRAWLRATVALVAAAAAFVLYVEARRRMFPAPLAAELDPKSPSYHYDGPLTRRVFGAILRWYAQPSLPKDPLNNPLVHAEPLYRVAGAVRVWFRGLGQVVCPLTLSGDYSAPQEPAPSSPWNVEILFGWATLLAPFVLAPVLARAAYKKFRGNAAPSLMPAIAVALLWVAISYFPVSNIPILLPTVRAERFWYFPVIGTSLLLGVGWSALYRHYRETASRWVTIVLVVVFFLFQSFAARWHANDYTDDLTFWDATRKAVPRSAKAHLNYSVMKGARGDLQARLDANKIALELAPQWPMASIYYGDTLCRLHRAPEAWPHYTRGFELAPNDVNLIALALQCLWDEKLLVPESNVRIELADLKDKHKGTWLEFLTNDILEHGEQHKGVDPKYRPRGYNEGPKEDKDEKKEPAKSEDAPKEEAPPSSEPQPE